MNIKQAVIDTNNALCYIVITLVLISGAIAAVSGNIMGGALIVGIGWTLCCLLYGFWFVLATIAENTTAQNVLTEKQNKLIEKLNRSLEAHSNNQFPSE